jgi:anti-sigma factor RsiW
VSCEAEKVTAFVDGALDAQEKERIDRHVQACGECRAQADGERDLRRRLSALRPPVPGDLLEARVRRALSPSRGGRWTRWAAPAAAAAVVIAWAHGAPAVVATQLAWDHGHCFGQQTLPAKIWTADPERMEAWLDHEGTAARPALPESAGGLEMVGGRHCPLMDRRVAHVYYTGGDQRLSVYVVPGWVRLDRAQGMRRGDKTVRLLRAGDATIGLVSERPEAVEAFERALTVTAAEERVPLLRAAR